MHFLSLKVLDKLELYHMKKVINLFGFCRVEQEPIHGNYSEGNSSSI